MSLRLFISGIGTDVGKTLAAAIITEALQADYWKPVQSGNDQPDSKTVADLVSNPLTKIHPEAYSFKAPLSPHQAAALEQRSIDMAQIIIAPGTSNHLVIEGAGGLLVPLNDGHYAIDLARACDAEVVLVIRNYLGCINHSLLSIAYLKSNGFRIKGLVLNGDFAPEVRSAIVKDGDIPVLAEIPVMNDISRDTVKQQAARINLKAWMP